MSDFSKDDIADLKNFMASLQLETKVAMGNLDTKMDTIQSQLKDALQEEIKANVSPIIEKQEQLFQMFSRLEKRVSTLEVPPQRK